MLSDGARPREGRDELTLGARSALKLSRHWGNLCIKPFTGPGVGRTKTALEIQSRPFGAPTPGAVSISKIGSVAVMRESISLSARRGNGSFTLISYISRLTQATALTLARTNWQPDAAQAPKSYLAHRVTP